MHHVEIIDDDQVAGGKGEPEAALLDGSTQPLEGRIVLRCQAFQRLDIMEPNATAVGSCDRLGGRSERAAVAMSAAEQEPGFPQPRLVAGVQAVPYSPQIAE